MRSAMRDDDHFATPQANADAAPAVAPAAPIGWRPDAAKRARGEDHGGEDDAESAKPPRKKLADTAAMLADSGDPAPAMRDVFDYSPELDAFLVKWTTTTDATWCVAEAAMALAPNACIVVRAWVAAGRTASLQVFRREHPFGMARTQNLSCYVAVQLACEAQGLPNAVTHEKLNEFIKKKLSPAQIDTFAGIFKMHARSFVKHCMKRNKVFDVNYKLIKKKLLLNRPSKIEGAQRITSRPGVYVLLAKTWEHVGHALAVWRTKSPDEWKAGDVSGWKRLEDHTWLDHGYIVDCFEVALIRRRGAEAPSVSILEADAPSSGA